MPDPITTDKKGIEIHPITVCTQDATPNNGPYNVAPRNGVSYRNEWTVGYIFLVPENTEKDEIKDEIERMRINYKTAEAMRATRNYFYPAPQAVQSDYRTHINQYEAEQEARRAQVAKEQEEKNDSSFATHDNSFFSKFKTDDLYGKTTTAAYELAIPENPFISASYNHSEVIKGGNTFHFFDIDTKATAHRDIKSEDVTHSYSLNYKLDLILAKSQLEIGENNFSIGSQLSLRIIDVGSSLVIDYNDLFNSQLKIKGRFNWKSKTETLNLGLKPLSGVAYLYNEAEPYIIVAGKQIEKWIESGEVEEVLENLKAIPL